MLRKHNDKKRREVNCANSTREMLLSMYMIGERIHHLNSMTTIIDGSRDIRGVRLFSDEGSIDNTYLYVGRVRDFLSKGISNQILLMHRNDVISIEQSDLHYVFNLVLNIFEFYSDLEEYMASGIFRANPEQFVISACESLAGPMFVMTQDYRILACSQNYSEQYVNKFWKSFVLNKEPEIETIYKMRTSKIVSLQKEHQMLEVFREPAAVPYEYGIISSYEDLNGKKIGSFILASKEEITQYEKNIAEIVLESLKRIQNVGKASALLHKIDSTEEIFLSYILEGKETIRSLNYLKALTIFNAQDRYYFVVADVEGMFALNNLREDLAVHFIDGITICHENHVVLLVGGKKSHLFDDMMHRCKRISDKLPVRFGVSNFFIDLDFLKYYYEQAVYALGVADNPLTLFENVAVTALLECGDAMFKRASKHPGVLYLEKIDYDNQSELALTLKTYLQCERSIKKAADKLYIHRNTVLYRINQIKDMKLFELDNDEQRQYILLSLLIT